MLLSRCQALLVIVFLWVNAAPLRAGTLAQFRTVLGDIEVELMDADKPVTTRNFIRYVESGAYSNMFLHRCVPGFIVQGGGFAITNAITSTNDFTRYVEVPNFGMITNEFLVGPRVSNTYGTIAMAKLGGNPHSASSQWFFNTANNSANLDNQNGGFTVFGRVVRGTNVLESFNSRQKGTTAAKVGRGIIDLQWWFPGNSAAATFSDLPVTYFTQTGKLIEYPDYNTLIYVDVTLLQVQVTRGPSGAPAIAWNSVSNRLNHVEFTTQFPPAWQSLVSTNGTGARFSVTDTNAGTGARFYRVRADF